MNKMPWLNLINKQFKTHITTDVSEEYRERLRADGWREATDLEWRIVTAIEGYKPENAARALQNLIDWSRKHDPQRPD